MARGLWTLNLDVDDRHGPVWIEDARPIAAQNIRAAAEEILSQRTVRIRPVPGMTLQSFFTDPDGNRWMVDGWENVGLRTRLIDVAIGRYIISSDIVGPGDLSGWQIRDENGRKVLTWLITEDETGVDSPDGSDEQRIIGLRQVWDSLQNAQRAEIRAGMVWGQVTSVPHFQDHASDNWEPEGAGSDGVVNRSWSGRRSNMLSWSTCSIW